METAAVFGRVRSTSGLIIASFIGLHLLLKALVFSETFSRLAADPIYAASHGVIAHSTSAAAVCLVVLAAFLLGVARLRPADFGLSSRNLLNGLFVTLFVWAAAQATIVVFGRIDGGNLFFGPMLLGDRAQTALQMGQAIGLSSLVEEVTYRGFLLPQLCLVLLATGKLRWQTCLAIALVASQAYFAAAHAPAAFRQGLSLTTASVYLIQVFVVGLLFAAVYVRTGNLFVAVGLHGLINVPGGLFTSGIDSSFVMLVLTCGVLLVWPYLARLLDEVFTMRPELAASPVGKGHLQYP